MTDVQGNDADDQDSEGTPKPPERLAEGEGEDDSGEEERGDNPPELSRLV